jgi:aminodeoxyfutalosine deaminase
MTIFSAPWVVPVAAPVISDGSIVVDEDRIIDIGTRDYIVHKYRQYPEISYPCVLMPGLTNAHMHLELSYLQNTIESQPEKNFTDWIESLIAKRYAQTTSRKKIVEAFTTALDDQYRSGVVLIGDIGNEYYDELHCLQSHSQPKIIRMLEFLGPNRETSKKALLKITQLDKQIAVTGHAPYSTEPLLLKEIKQRCNRLQHIFSIHTAESRDEREFVRKGRGAFRNFLEKKNSWDGAFPFNEFEFSGTVQYFDNLNLLDNTTLLVHCVHVSETELKLIKKRGSQICLCPGSNDFLGVGLAPVEQMVKLGLLPALGSDSPASNNSIDIWNEMQLLSKKHTHLEDSTVLAIATLGGARALKQDSDFGSLLAGKKAKFIHVSSAELKNCNDEKQLMKELVSGGKPTEITWVPTDHK